VPIAAETHAASSRGKEKSKTKPANDDSSLILEGPCNRKSVASKDMVPLTEKGQTNNNVRPEWFTTAKAYLGENISSPSWHKCIELWMEFESKSNFAGTSVGFDTQSLLKHKLRLNSQHRINAQSHPEILSCWVPNHKYHIIPEIDDKQKFAEEWLKWWNSLQPI